MRKDSPDSEGHPGRRPSSGPARGPTEGLSELLKRLLEAGAKNLSAEPMRQLLSDMKIPKDALLHLLSQHVLMQLEETKQNVYRLVSRELKGLMERTNVADEIATALTKLSLEVTMQVRFSPKDGDTGTFRVRRAPREAEPSPGDPAASDRSAAGEPRTPGVAPPPRPANKE